jgi:putative hemolysin
MIALIIGIVITVLLVAFFEGIEIAFVSTNKLSIELRKKQGKKSGIILSKFLEKPSSFMAALLIGANIMLVIYGLLVSKLMAPLWNYIHIENAYVKLLVETLLGTLIILIFGGLLPKAIFRAKNDALLNFFAPAANFFYAILLPISTFFVGMAQWILKIIFDVKLTPKSEAFGKTDVEFYYQQTKENDDESAELNQELFENALQLPSVKIRECLVPRKEIIALPITATVQEATLKFIETKLSRLIILEENIDNIVGYIHHLDLFKNPSTLQEIIMPISAVPESMTASDLITKLTMEHRSVAWVVDEFGGTSGIVTLEDVLEEIFGEIKDEYDTEDFVDKQLSADEFIFAGRLELDYLQQQHNLEFEEVEAETLSGYIIAMHGSIPTAEERIIIGRQEFTIINVSDTRIESVKLRKLK